MHQKILIRAFFLIWTALHLSIPASMATELQTRSEVMIDSSTSFVRLNFITESSVQYAVNASYSYSLSPEFQIGIQGAIYNSGTQIDPFRLSILIPFTYNWGGDVLANDFFIRLAPGISYNYALDGALLLQFGKRFQIFEHLSLRPTVGLSGYFFNGAPRSAVDIVPVAFSITF